MAGPAVPWDPCRTVTMERAALGTARPCPQHHVWYGTGHSTSPHGRIPVAQCVPKRGTSLPLCFSSCFSNKNKGSSHSLTLAPSALVARPSNLPRYPRDPQPQGRRAGGVPMSLARHPAGRGRAGPPRGSGQPASHEPGRAATAAEQTPFVWDRVVGASGSEASEPALPPSPRRDPRLGKGPCRAGPGRAGGSAARQHRTGRGVTSAREQPRNPGWLWDAGRAIAAPLPTTAPPTRPRRTHGRDASPAQPHGGTPRQGWGAGGAGWAGTCRGRREAEAAAGAGAELGPGPGPGGAARGSTKPPAPHWVQ